LSLADKTLIVCRARFGGRMMLGGAVAEINDAPVVG